MADNKESLPEPVGFGLMIRPNATATAEDFVLVPGLAGYTTDQMHAFREAGVSELRAEVERYKAALMEIMWHRKPGGSPSKYQYEVERIAAAALGMEAFKPDAARSSSPVGAVQGSAEGGT